MCHLCFVTPSRRTCSAGPRLLVCGKAVTITGGLGANVHTQQLGPTEGWVAEADGPDGLRAAVRSQLKAGADWIKLYYHRGDWTREELAAAVGEAHGIGARVACHAIRPEAIKHAIAAGVDTIEHGIMLDERDAAAMAERGIALVPTLLIVEASATPLQGASPQALQTREDHRRAFQLAHVAGVTIGAGVDAVPDEGVVPFAALADELGLMVDLGMDPAEAVRAATSSAAKILGLDDASARCGLGSLPTSSASTATR